GFLERGETRLLSLAQQLLLKLLAGGGLLGGRRLARRGGRGGRRHGLGRFGDRLGRRRRRSFAGTAQDAALLDLDDDRVRAAVAEALLHLARLDRALEAQRRPGAKLRFVGLVCHSIPYSVSSAEPVLKAGSPPSRPRSGPVKARHRAIALLTREAAAGSVRATCTTFSRPNANDNIVRPSGNITPCGAPPPTLQAWSIRLRPSSLASSAWTRRRTLPARAAASTLSAPLMRLPARASMPRRSSAVLRSACSIRSPRLVGTCTPLVLNARWRAGLSLPLALAASSSARETPIQAPRPGARARTSGATSPSGESASLISSSFVALRRVRMQVRSGSLPSRSREGPG